MEGELKPLKQNTTLENFIILWKQNIIEILTYGNAFTGHSKKIKMFSDAYSQKEMIVYCLVKLKSLHDNKNYSIQYPNDKNKVTRVKYIENEQECFIPIDEFDIEASKIIYESN